MQKMKANSLADLVKIAAKAATLALGNSLGFSCSDNYDAHEITACDFAAVSFI